jgi:hypothetical protein
VTGSLPHGSTVLLTEVSHEVVALHLDRVWPRCDRPGARLRRLVRCIPNAAAVLHGCSLGQREWGQLPSAWSGVLL